MASPLDQDALEAALAEAGYFADEGLVTALYLALELGKPLLLEGMPGVGKTEVGNVLARILGRDCIRLQCYEGIDASRALYDWDHVRQLLHVRVAEKAGPVETAELYAPEFLVEMPLLKALRNAGTAILLIDEIDRADDAFEAFLLEFLSDFQISIPEIGTVRAAAAGGDDPDLEPHARAARRAAAALPLPLDRLSRPGARAGDRRAPRARHRRRGGRAAGRRRWRRRGGCRWSSGRASPRASTGRAARWCWSATAPPGPTRCAARSGCWSRTRRTASSSSGPRWHEAGGGAAGGVSRRRSGRRGCRSIRRAARTSCARCGARRLRDAADLARVGRVTLTGSREEFPLFDQVFAAWFGGRAGRSSRPSPRRRPRRRRATGRGATGWCRWPAGPASGRAASRGRGRRREGVPRGGRGRSGGRSARLRREFARLPEVRAAALGAGAGRARLDLARTGRAARRTFGETLRLLRQARAGAAAADAAAGRRLGLDEGAVGDGPALRAGADPGARAGRDLHLRHPADPGHRRAPAPRRRGGAGAAGGGGQRLRRRHAHRRGAGDVPRHADQRGAGARRGGRSSSPTGSSAAIRRR